MIYIILKLFRPFSEPLYPVDGCKVILEETTSFGSELIYYRIRLIIGLICSEQDARKKVLHSLT